ncbi:MAG: hypothetical protein FJ145_12400 [Deltaproteobacteria bacterium]|nr:hypothetical protein [Deltaproteobacteria bacterium]
MPFSAARAEHKASASWLTIAVKWAGKYFYAAGLLVFLAFLPDLCRADIFLEARVGFHGVFQLGRPFPLEIELSNNGRPAEGILEVRAWKGGATRGGALYPIDHRREVFLGSQGRKTVQFTIDPDFISRPLAIKFTSPAGNAARELDLRRNFVPTPLMLLVGDGGALPSLALGAAATNRLVALSLPELPGDARALLGVSHLIIYDASLRELSRAQLNALDTWLIAGGRMVILASLNYALYQEASLSRFLPVRVSGARRITYTTAAEKNQPARSVADVWAQTATLTQGKVVTEAQGLPVHVEQSRGRGSVVYFALDIGRPPLSGWAGLPSLVQSLVGTAAGDESSVRSQWDDAVFTQLILNPSFISSYVPTGTALIALAVYFAGLGVVTWLWQRQELAARLVVMSLAGWIAAASLGGYLYFSRGGKIPDGVLLVSSVTEQNSEGFVESQSNIALFSTQSRSYELQPERGWIDLQPAAARAREQADAVVVRQDGSGASRYHLPLREWDYRLFRMRAVTRLPLRAQFEAQGDKLAMKIDNQSGKDLVDCWLFVPGQRYALGAIQRGASLAKTFSLTKPAGQDERMTDGVNFRDLHFSDKTRDILFHSSLFSRENEARWSSGAAVFFGWIKDPEPRVRIDDPQILKQEYALFRAIIPLARVEEE